MPSNPPTVADLVAEVAVHCAEMLADVGLYLRSADGTTPAILVGLRKGARAVYASLADPMKLRDSDVALMSGPAVERVLDEAKLEALRWVLLHWHRATETHQEPLSSTPVISGSLVDERRGIKDRIADLKAICDQPFREPTDQAVAFVRGRSVATGDPAVPTPPPYPAGYPYGLPYPYGYGEGYGYPYGGGYCP